MRTTAADTLIIRRSRPGDAGALRRLAERDSAHVPAGDLLVAEADGHLRAALAPLSGTVIADPFHPSAPLVTLLRDAAAGRVPKRRTWPGLPALHPGGRTMRTV